MSVAELPLPAGVAGFIDSSFFLGPGGGPGGLLVRLVAEYLFDCPDGPLSRLLTLLVSSELELSSGWLDDALATEVDDPAPVEEATDEVGERDGNDGAATAGAACFGGELATNFLTSFSVSLLRSILTTASFFSTDLWVELFTLLRAEVGSSF